ncbi:MAG: outer membrane protein assembly factor BamA [candidate division Zixibacteria bacterium]|nr:outer membrane protein assembly factor BamA [candidate division Zixibacteria bacterium]
MFAVLSVLLTADAAGQQLNIAEVEIAGNRTASSNLILSVASFNIGENITPSTIPNAVKRLYGLGFFSDIQIDAEEVIGGVKLLIRVTELPKLDRLEFKGNKEIKTDDLEELVNIAPGRYVSPNMIAQKENDIIDKYGEKGYFLAEVDHELAQSDDSSTAVLTFKIKEGSKIKVERVVMSGNNRLESDKIIGKMRNRKRGFLKSSNFDKEKYPEDKEKIIDYMHSEGYIDAYLKSDSMTVDTARNRMTIYLDVYEGPRYYFGTSSFSGNEIFDSTILAKTLKYREGEVFDREKYDESIYELYFLYQERGYLHLRVIDDLNTRDSLIDITFDLVEGLPSKINLVKITGNTKTKEKVIRREMTTRPGQVFHRSFLMRSMRDVMALNFFENVVPDIVDLPSGDVDVLIDVTEKQTGQISAGAGYSGQDKFVGTFGMGIPNFRGMGQNLSFNIDIGSNRNSYSISFTEPWLFSTPTSLGADLYYTNRVWYDDYTEGSRGASVVVGRRLRWPDNYFRAYARFRIEDNRFYDFEDDYIYGNSYLSYDHYNNYQIDDTTYILNDTSYAAVGDPLPGSLMGYNEEWLSLKSLQFTLTRDSRNLPEFATSGSKLSYSMEYVGGLLGGYWEYQKHTLSAAKFIPVIWDIALAGKVTFGAIYAPEGDNRILASDRFSPGGTGYDGIVRGYDDGSLTPDSMQHIVVPHRYWNADTSAVLITLDKTVSSEVRVRGKYMLVGNFELQIPIMKNQLYAMLFYDVGNSWLYHRDINLDDMYHGVGIGFRLVVPALGTIGFDFGYPLSDVEGEDKSWHPHFQIGTTFR